MNGLPDLDAVVLVIQFGARWDIVNRPNCWSAERQEPGGRSLRYIVGRSPKELAEKLAIAETVEP
jgi:hypothetical protein